MNCYSEESFYAREKFGDFFFFSQMTEFFFSFYFSQMTEFLLSRLYEV